MSELETKYAINHVTSYLLGREKLDIGARVAMNHQDATVTIDDGEGTSVTLVLSEALGLLDVLTHERERLHQWVREEAG